MKAISKDININFGLERCASICLKKGRVQSKIYIGNTIAKCIKELGPREAYKYLDREKSYDILHKNKKEKLKKEYLRRFRSVLGTELSAKNKIQAIGSLAVPVLRYSFGTVNHSWTASTKGRCRELDVPRKQGERVLTQLKEAYAVEITKLVEYAD